MPTIQFRQRQWLGYLVAVASVVVVTALLKLFGSQVNHTTIALALLLNVLFIAAKWGSKPAVLASLTAVACFNFFYLPPVGTFSISDPHNWIAFFAFLITALTAGQLSARVKRRAEEAEVARKEVERLYNELQVTFERSSQAKALKQSERLKSALLDAVTHDLRTPLTSIKASVTTLLEDSRVKHSNEDQTQLASNERREMLEIIDEEADRLDRFVEDLMALARIEAGEMQLRREWTSLAEIINTVMTRAAPLTKQHRIELWLDDELPSVRVDERAVAEVIYVLLDNAVKYSPEGTVVRLIAKSGEDEMVRINIEDQGPGVPKELRQQVFEKFFRAMRDGDAVPQRRGSGMGLAIAKGIVEAHGGKIWLEEVEGLTGTRVSMLLPTGDV